jgi:hypothetical protein
LIMVLDDVATHRCNTQLVRAEYFKNALSQILLVPKLKTINAIREGWRKPFDVIGKRDAPNRHSLDYIVALGPENSRWRKEYFTPR